MNPEQEEFLSVLLTTTEEQQEAIAKAIKQFERENRALSISVPMLRKSLEASLAEAMTETASTAKTAVNDDTHIHMRFPCMADTSLERI